MLDLQIIGTGRGAKSVYDMFFGEKGLKVENVLPSQRRCAGCQKPERGKAGEPVCESRPQILHKRIATRTPEEGYFISADLTALTEGRSARTRAPICVQVQQQGHSNRLHAFSCWTMGFCQGLRENETRFSIAINQPGTRQVSILYMWVDTLSWPFCKAD